MASNQTNNSSVLSDDPIGLMHFLNVLWYLSYAIIFIFGTIGNSIVIITLVNSFYNEYSTRFLMNNRNHSFNQNNQVNNLNKITNNPANNNNANINSMWSLNRPIVHVVSINNQQVGSCSPSHSTISSTNRAVKFHHFLEKNVRRFAERKLSVTSFYLLNLALSDFLYTFFIPFLMVTMFYEKWIFGRLFCKFYFSIIYLCQFQSVFVMVLLSIDRYISINFPHKLFTFRNNNKPRIIMLFVWFASFLFTTPIMMYANLYNETCSVDWPTEWTTGSNSSTATLPYFLPLHAFTVYSFVLSYLLPVSIIVILYTKILIRLSKLNKLRSFKISDRQKKTRRHITKLVLIVIIFYIISWTPYWCMQVFHYINQMLLKYENDLTIAILTHFVQVVAYLSSATNPIIYSYMNETFRTDLNFVFESCNFHFCITSRLSRKSRQNEPNNETNHNLNNKNITNIVINEVLDENEI
jgi:hypothetical protein